MANAKANIKKRKPHLFTGAVIGEMFVIGFLDLI